MTFVEYGKIDEIVRGCVVPSSLSGKIPINACLQEDVMGENVVSLRYVS